METFYQKLQKLSHDGQSKEVDLQALYKTKYSEWPQDGFPCMPQRHQWKSKVREVYPNFRKQGAR